MYPNTLLTIWFKAHHTLIQVELFQMVLKRIVTEAACSWNHIIILHIKHNTTRRTSMQFDTPVCVFVNMISNSTVLDVFPLHQEHIVSRLY